MKPAFTPTPLFSDFQMRLSTVVGRAAQSRASRFMSGAAAASIRGPVRKENQDRAVIAKLVSERRRDSYLIAIVCDGMGGLRNGGQAATIAASSFLASFLLSEPKQIAEIMADAMQAANWSVYKMLDGAGGTTLTALIVPKTGPSWCAHVGDSRLYVRNDKRVIRLSNDDTLNGFLSNKKIASTASGDEGLLQYVGMGSDLQPHITNLSISTALSRDPLYILTTDGAHRVDQSVFNMVCENAETPDEIARRLLLLAEALGARDNATVIALEPGEFFDTKNSSRGETLSLWTPWDRFDLWLRSDYLQIADGRVARGENQQDQKRPVKIANKKKLKIRRSAKSTKTKPSVDKRGTPPLLVAFDSDDDQGADD